MAALRSLFSILFLASTGPSRALKRDERLATQSACFLGNISGSGWRPADRSASGGRNVCVQGKLVPELYVLGAPKCATTSFAFEIAGAGAECAAGTKEYQFWGQGTLRGYADAPAQTTGTWAAPLPACDSSSRRVVADFTPEYLALTTRPNRTLREEIPDGPAALGLPGVLSDIYGRKARRIQFVVMVREPLARMQSWWYYCGKQQGFQAHAEDELTRRMGSAWHSTYGWQLREWTRVFRPKQFYVIPFKLFSGEASRQICNDISLRLNFRMTCSSAVEDQLHGSHPPLTDDVTAEFRAFFDVSMAGDRAILVDTLAEGSTEGMGLPMFDGRPGEQRAVQSWLLDAW